MKKCLIALSVLLGCYSGSYAKQIDGQTAKSVAQNFWTRELKSRSTASTGELNLVYKAIKSNDLSATCFYVYNSGSHGFIIVAGDDNATPILGYSDETTFDAVNIPPSVAAWLNGYKEEISYIIDHNILASSAVASKWTSLKSAASANAKTTGVTLTGPYTTTQWNQGNYFNQFCPFDAFLNQRSITGCTSTAMSQIMKYWNYPATGTGSHSYMHSQYGLLTADFGSTTYQWASMPNVVSTTNPAVGTLLYHTGVSVDMNYSPSGSGAWVISYNNQIQESSEVAFPAYFGYKHSIIGLQRGDYTVDEWFYALKMELNGSRPILYAGYNSASGHAFVMDGYDDGDLFHFNWGWGGSYNGYFSLDAMTPGGHNYNSNQEALIGIEPAQHTSLALNLHNVVTAPATVKYQHAFSVTTSLINNGTIDFSGDYGARVFDMAGNIVDSLQLMIGESLVAGDHTNTLTFSTTGSHSMVPGDYYIGIYYRPSGKTWFEAGETGGFTNQVPITVINNVGIETPTATNFVKVYPNPASDVININAGDASITNVVVTDLHGSVVFTKEIAKAGSVTIPAAQLAQGMYFVKVQTNKGIQTDKIVIKR